MEVGMEVGCKMAVHVRVKMPAVRAGGVEGGAVGGPWADRGRTVGDETQAFRHRFSPRPPLHPIGEADQPHQSEATSECYMVLYSPPNALAVSIHRLNPLHFHVRELIFATGSWDSPTFAGGPFSAEIRTSYRQACPPLSMLFKPTQAI